MNFPRSKQRVTLFCKENQFIATFEESISPNNLRNKFVLHNRCCFKYFCVYRKYLGGAKSSYARHHCFKGHHCGEMSVFDPLFCRKICTRRDLSTKGVKMLLLFSQTLQLVTLSPSDSQPEETAIINANLVLEYLFID